MANEIVRDTVHEISMQYIMVNPIYNIESNVLLNFLTNDLYGRGGFKSYAL